MEDGLSGLCQTVKTINPDSVRGDDITMDDRINKKNEPFPTQPNSLRNPTQKYRLTEKGRYAYAKASKKRYCGSKEYK